MVSIQWYKFENKTDALTWLMFPLSFAYLG